MQEIEDEKDQNRRRCKRRIIATHPYKRQSSKAETEEIYFNHPHSNIKSIENNINASSINHVNVSSSNSGTSKKCRRNVFLPTEESSYLDSPEIVNYFIASKTFHQNVDKGSNTELPRKKIKNHWDALESIVHLRNPEIEEEFEEQRQIFENEGKVDKYGNVPEYLLFHGTTNESINKIAETNFLLDHLPKTRGKLMLFGTGTYFSELPGVSLMYGECLLLCKVLLGKIQRYHPNGQPPPEIPEGFDSRIVVRDGLDVVTVVKKPSQILPFCIVNIKRERIEQSGPIPTAAKNEAKQEVKDEDEDSDRDDPKTSPNQEQMQKG